MGLIGGTYQGYFFPTWTLFGLWQFIGQAWGEELSQTFPAFMVICALFGFPVIAVGGAFSLLALPMSEDRRGILSFFVLITSFTPSLFLAFDVLNFILPLWPLLIIATGWAVLLWMGLRIFRRRN
jgi:hypothetical protein